MKRYETYLFMFDVYDFQVDKETRNFIAAKNLDDAFGILNDSYPGGAEGYDFFSVRNLGLVSIDREETE